METLQNIFEAMVSDVCERLFEIKTDSKDVRKEDLEPSPLFSKQIEVSYGYASGTIQLVLHDNVIDALKSHSEESIKGFYPSMDIPVLCSNLLGIIVHAMFNRIKDIYSSLDFDLPKTASPSAVFNHDLTIALKKEDETIIGYIGGNFSHD